MFGAGPGLGRAVARRYVRDGYEVVLVARRQESLERLAEDLRSGGAQVRIVAADLSDPDAIPGLADDVRAEVGDLDVVYYAPTPDGGFVPAADLTSERAMEFMPLTFYRLLDIVGQFLPSMLERGNGAVLTAQGASSVRGMPNLSGPGPAQAAQRNYLQSLHAEMIDKGIYVGMLYVGAIIEDKRIPLPGRRRRREPSATGGRRSIRIISPTCCGTCTSPRTTPKSVTPKTCSSAEWVCSSLRRPIAPASAASRRRSTSRNGML